MRTVAVAKDTLNSFLKVTKAIFTSSKVKDSGDNQLFGLYLNAGKLYGTIILGTFRYVKVLADNLQVDEGQDIYLVSDYSKLLGTLSLLGADVPDVIDFDFSESSGIKVDLKKMTVHLVNAYIKGEQNLMPTVLADYNQSLTAEGVDIDGDEFAKILQVELNLLGSEDNNSVIVNAGNVYSFNESHSLVTKYSDPAVINKFFDDSLMVTIADVKVLVAIFTGKVKAYYSKGIDGISVLNLSMDGSLFQLLDVSNQKIEVIMTMINDLIKNKGNQELTAIKFAFSDLIMGLKATAIYSDEEDAIVTFTDSGLVLQPSEALGEAGKVVSYNKTLLDAEVTNKPKIDFSIPSKLLLASLDLLAKTDEDDTSTIVFDNTRNAGLLTYDKLNIVFGYSEID